MGKEVKDLKSLVGTVAREEIRTKVTADELLEEVTKESDGNKENREFFDKVSADVEVAINDVTNRISLMVDGTIPSDYKDLATLYRRMSIMASQIRAIQNKAKQAIITDPAVPDNFYAGGSSFTLEVTTRNMFDKALFKKTDPGLYTMVFDDPAYKKVVVVNKLSHKALGGGS